MYSYHALTISPGRTRHAQAWSVPTTCIAAECSLLVQAYIGNDSVQQQQHGRAASRTERLTGLSHCALAALKNLEHKLTDQYATTNPASIHAHKQAKTGISCVCTASSDLQPFAMSHTVL